MIILIFDIILDMILQGILKFCVRFTATLARVSDNTAFLVGITVALTGLHHAFNSLLFPIHIGLESMTQMKKQDMKAFMNVNSVYIDRGGGGEDDSVFISGDDMYQDLYG